MNDNAAPKPTIFISYSHKDESWKVHGKGKVEMALAGLFGAVAGHTTPEAAGRRFVITAMVLATATSISAFAL